ncbi:uncharacterized protein [Montipora capricornis]|uniref:uncharacterized protein n=1 Tax=Montipora foliosa TaxID=591990 RepID=UPI0035F16085
MIRQPSSTMIVGPSGSGKTQLTEALLTEGDVFEGGRTKPCHYCYAVWQPRFERMKGRGIRFHEGIPDIDHLRQWFGKSGGGILVLDDLMDEGGNDKRVLDLFTRESHHRNITVLYLCQDLFPPGKYAKTISRNAHYLFVFKNPRDQSGFRALTLQAFPDRWRDVLRLFERCTQRPYGYIMMDLHPASDDRYRLFSCVTPSDGPTQVWKRE